MSTQSVENKAQFYWCFIPSGTLSMDSGLVCPRDQFQSVTREDTAKQKTKELVLIAMLSLSRLSLPSSFNLFVRRAAAHFWSTVICLCQTPKRLRNEEGHMKRGWVTVAAVCNHTHTETVTAESRRTSSPVNPLHHPFSFANSVSPYQPLQKHG